MVNVISCANVLQVQRIQHAACIMHTHTNTHAHIKHEQQRKNTHVVV